MSEKLNDVIDNLRAIIISFKGALPLVNVQRDYEEAFGEKVPLKSSGYVSLRELFEKNPSEFKLIGDKVITVEKTKSAHISSLVQRQNKGKTVKNVTNFARHRRPRYRDGPGGFEYYSSISSKHETFKPWRQTNGKNVLNDVNGSKPHVKTDSIEKITLRKPRETKQNVQNPVKLPSLLEITTNYKSMTKTTLNETSSPLGLSKEVECLQPFKDVEDLPVGKGAQSRLLKTKYRMIEDLKSSEDNQIPIPETESEPLRMYFDIPSNNTPPIHFPITESLPPTSSSIANIGAPFSNTIQMELSNPRQKAQARIVNIKSSMQANLMQLEKNKNANNDEFVLSSIGNDAATRNNFNEYESDSALNSLKKQEISDVTYDARNIDKKSEIITNNPDSDQSIIIDNTTHYMNALEDLCKSRGFQKPTYKIIVREPKNEPKHYICKISIENYLQISSYPLETLDERSAKNKAIKKMLDYLHTDPNFTHNRNINAKEEEIIPRILEIVSPTYGVWSDKLPLLYKEKYEEDLRKDWLNIITKTTFFEINNFDGNRFIVRKKTDVNSSSLELNVETGKRHLAQPETPTLKELILPKTEYWEVYITNVSSCDEIWCRLIGDESDAYDDLMTKLELEPPERKALKPIVGGIYGVKVSAIWYRVELIEILEDRRGMAFYIDVGDKDIIDLTELYEPEEVFFSVAPQAIMLSLHELESFSNDEELKAVITGYLLGNTYIAEILAITEDIYHFHRKRKTVKLWDTSTERDINVNQLLLNNVIKNIGIPTLPSINQIKEVMVSSISSNGDIHIQTNKKSIHHLKCLIFNKIKSVEGSPLRRKPNDTVGTEILHLTKCQKNDVFSRVKVIEIKNSAYVDVLFIDYGFVERTAISDLIHLEKSSILQAIPAQAVKVRLSNVTNFNTNMISKLKEFLLDQNVLMKMIETNRGSTPNVEFFRRSASGNTLYSVNQKIVSDPELKNSDISKRRKSIVVGLEKVLPRNLPPPNIPEIGQHFQVFVTFATSPDLFIVQPESSRMLLMEMMNELQTICNGTDMEPLSPDECIVGELYAVKHPDGNWYRGCVQAVLGSCNYSIFMCDFGDCIMVTNDKLRCLPEKFQTVPYQAIRATLYGIPPELRDWTPVDCINFHQLVVEKYFVSVVKEIQRDEKNPNFVNLGLILIDTSGEEDIYIHKDLMEKKNEAFTFIKSLSIT